MLSKTAMKKQGFFHAFQPDFLSLSLFVYLMSVYQSICNSVWLDTKQFCPVSMYFCLSVDSSIGLSKLVRGEEEQTNPQQTCQSDGRPIVTKDTWKK